MQMWLPPDERRLLAGYYRLIRDVGDERVYWERTLRHLLPYCWRPNRVRQYEEPESESVSDDLRTLKKQMCALLRETARVERANRILSRRGLITYGRHASELSVVLIALTTDGYDLGRRYSSFWDRSGLWFETYRNHWIWLVLGFLGGVAGGLLVNWLSPA